MKKRTGLVLAGIVIYLLNLSHAYAAYDILKRSKLVDDRINSLEITRPIKHDFFINIRAMYAPEIQDIMDDADKIEKIDTSDTAVALTEINATLEKYYNKEQIIKADVGLGFPLPSFSISKLRVKPNFRVEGGLFAMITPEKVKLNLTDIITNIEAIPVEFRDKLIACIATPPADGTDLLVYCVGKGGFTQADADFIRLAGINKIPYSTLLASSKVDTPAINVYAKGQGKAGFFTEYRAGKHFFGHFNLYALGRADIKKRADALLLLGGGSGFDFQENTLINAVFDYSLGYKNANYSTFIGLEEVKISEISSETTKLNWGDDMLVRLHAQADFRLSVFKFRPYLGSHMRSGYSIADAYYLGADWGVFVFKDRLGLNFKTQMDKEHFTLGLRAKIWVIHMDLTGKFPVTNKVDGMEVSNYYGANFRLFF